VPNFPGATRLPTRMIATAGGSDCPKEKEYGDSGLGGRRGVSIGKKMVNLKKGAQKSPDPCVSFCLPHQVKSFQSRFQGGEGRPVGGGNWGTH